MDQAIERRKDEATQEAQGYTATQLRIFESLYFGVWAKLLLERRYDHSFATHGTLLNVAQTNIIYIFT